MTITERIEAAINATEKPTAVVLGPKEAGELLRWLVFIRYRQCSSRPLKIETVKGLEGMTYNGVTIQLSEKAGIDILT